MRNYPAARIIARKLGMNDEDVLNVIKAWTDLLIETICKDGEAIVTRIGRFHVTTRTHKRVSNPKLSKNPKKAGAARSMSITAKNTVRFSAGGDLKAKTNDLPKIYKTDSPDSRRYYRLGSGLAGEWWLPLPRYSQFKVNQMLRIRDEYRGNLDGTGCFVNKILEVDLIEVCTLDHKGKKIFLSFREDQLTPFVFFDNLMPIIRTYRSQPEPLPKPE